MEFLMDWQNITLVNVLCLIAFVLIYPVYWVLVYKVMTYFFE